MGHPWIMKLEQGAELADEDRRMLERAVGAIRPVPAHTDLIREGDKPDQVHVVIEGLACRYKILRGGQRQIMAYLVPGDMCDLHVSILGAMDHSIGTLTACKIGYIPRETIDDLTSNHPTINRALWWATLTDEGTLREWLVGMGRREADRRMAHLFCELMVRLRTVGLAPGSSFEFPVTQEDLGDTLGLSTVHVNRVLQQLRKDGLISLQGKILTIHDEERLQAFADFDPNYLHLDCWREPKQDERRKASARG